MGSGVGARREEPAGGRAQGFELKGTATEHREGVALLARNPYIYSQAETGPEATPHAPPPGLYPLPPPPFALLPFPPAP
jgi:hypothetical protein